MWVHCTQGGEEEGAQGRAEGKKEAEERESRGDDRRQEAKADSQTVRRSDRHRQTCGAQPSRKMPDFTGSWKMKSSENFDELLKALGEDSLLFLLQRSECVLV